jgi:hypothetical protein
MVIEVTWKKSWSLLKTIISLPFVVIPTLFIVLFTILAFFWDCATAERMEDLRQETHRLENGVRVAFGPQDDPEPQSHKV